MLMSRDRLSSIGSLKTKPWTKPGAVASAVSEATLRSYIGRGPATPIHEAFMDKTRSNLSAEQIKYDRIKKKNDAAGRRSGPRPV